jgi:hypothetical protein
MTASTHSIGSTNSGRVPLLAGGMMTHNTGIQTDDTIHGTPPERYGPYGPYGPPQPPQVYILPIPGNSLIVI